MKLEDMPNIGKNCVSLLKKANINTPEELIKLGSKEAFFKILIIDPDACLNRLYGIEGAIQNIRWHNLSEEVKKELKEFYKSI